MTLSQITYIRFVKRFAAIVFLSLFLFNIIGYYFLFLVIDASNRNEMRSALGKENSLQTIRIHKSEIKNILFKKDGKEISFNGEMYDIKNKFFDGDYFVFHCKHDKKETSLLAGLNSYVKNNTNSNSTEKKQNNSSKNPTKDFFFIKINIPFIISSAVVFPDLICQLSSITLQVHTLPPEISFS